MAKLRGSHQPGTLAAPAGPSQGAPSGGRNPVGDSPLLAGWKLVMAALLPAKILLVTGHEDCFWLDRKHWRQALQLAVSRSGVRNPEFLRKVVHVAVLPFELCMLLGFAAKVHLARLARAAGTQDSGHSSD